MIETIPNERYISNLIQEQFPSVYNNDSDLFIEFLKTYYEWLEVDGNELSDTRSFLDYQNINKTPDSFLVNFQNTYLFGLPEETLLNRRLLIKHIKDVYRAKGTVKGWKLLFRLLFNEELDVYLPVVDLLAPSDGSWKKPKYIEINDNGKLDMYLGRTIIGASSGITAIVESVIREPINQNLVVTMFLSGIVPLNSEFIRGEKILIKDSGNPDEITTAPTILGSLSSIEIMNGGQDFAVGNILHIVNKDPVTNQILTTGVDSELRVVKISKGIGSIFYEIENGGWGYTYNPLIIQFNGNTDYYGSGASFEIGALTNVEYFTYNEDLLLDFVDVNLNAVSFGFNYNYLANMATPLLDTLHFVTKGFGTISSLTNIDTGNNYTEQLKLKLKEGIVTHPLAGRISYTSNTNNTAIIGNGTFFTTRLSVGDVILTSNSSNGQQEMNWVTSIANNTYLTVEGRYKNSVANGFYRIAVNPFVAVAAVGEQYYVDGTVKGENALITGIPSIGKGIIAQLESVNSGKGYHQDEIVKLYLFGAITQPMVANSGIGYANGDILIFNGGGTPYPANGIVRTDSSGGITSCDLISFGSSYKTVPTITIRSRKGTGAVLTTQLGDYNRHAIVRGRTKLSGLGKGQGDWTSTRSFLNSDKYIQDSYFYQNFSYQLKSPIDLNKYREMFQNLYHSAGFEMFGEYYKLIIIKNDPGILYEQPVLIGT